MNRIVKIVYNQIHWVLLAGVIYFAVWLRMFTANFDLILDFDPWWFFRHADEILRNGFLPPRWDILSYFPPGRPVDYYLGWSYTLAFFYALVRNFIDITLMRFSGLFVAFFAGITAIPAYFVGRTVTNRWGGLFTALFAAVTPTFLSVSIAGYPDSDSVDVFYTFLSVFTTFYAIKKSSVLSFENFSNFSKSFTRYLPHMLPALISYWLFAFNWNSSWYIYFIFLGFVPLLVIFRVIEAVVFRREKANFVNLIVSKVRENRGVIVSIVLLGLVGELLTLATSGWPFNTLPPHDQLIGGLNLLRANVISLATFVLFLGVVGAMTGLAVGRLRSVVIGTVAGVMLALVILSVGDLTGRPLLVNISVAELQIINVFSAEGFLQIVLRIGWMPVVFAFISFVLLFAKWIFKKEIHSAEYFAVIWLLISLVLITQGIRFSLLFSMSIATAAGLVIGNLTEFLKHRNNKIFSATFFGILIFGTLLHVSDNTTFAQQTGGLEVSDNWKEALSWLKVNAGENALVATWWDPGHIITGFTGLKVHADGAHCGVGCVPYNHDARIRDMGRILSTTNEQESIQLLRKYTQLTDIQKEAALRAFGSVIPAEAFEPVSEVYVIASSDLIGKYFWLSYFGSYDDATGQGNGINFLQFGLSGRDQDGNPVYSGPGGATITLALTQTNQIASILNAPSAGIRNSLITDVVAYQGGSELRFDFRNNTNAIDGMTWVSPDFQFVFFMQSEIRDSVFTKLFFFDGRGLQNFEPKFANSEVKIFKVKF